MVQATFFLDSSTKEDSKKIMKQILSSRMDNKSFTIVANEVIQNEYGGITVPLFYLTALNDDEAGLNLFVMDDSVGDPRTFLKDMIELAPFSGDYSILECTEYWKIDGCYEVGANLKTNGMTFEDYLMMLNKRSKQWSFTGLKASTDLNAPIGKILDMTCHFRSGIVF